MPTRLRWLAVILPVLLIAALDALVDGYLDPLVPAPFDVLVVPAGALVVAFVLGTVAFRRIDRLSAEMRARTIKLERSNASLMALRRAGAKVAELVQIETVLTAVVDDARALLGADVAFTSLVQPDGSECLAASSGERWAFVGSERRVEDPRDLVRAEFLAAHLAAPLQQGDRTIGMLMVGRKQKTPFAREDFETLSSLASQLAIALEKDRLQRELRELAIRGERERIAREMHDGLAQVLGYVNTKAQATAELLSAGRTDLARQQLDELSAAARSVYVDVREAILGLASPIAPERGLVGALEEYALRFSDASKLATNIEASALARRIDLAPEMQAQIFRIVQESLTNVRKHASADRVTVALDVRDGHLRVEVRDNGKGFDPDAPPRDGWPRYGAQAIRERAASIGAEATWIAGQDQGTAVRLVVPLRTTTAVHR